jgi:serine protease Do
MRGNGRDRMGKRLAFVALAASLSLMVACGSGQLFGNATGPTSGTTSSSPTPPRTTSKTTASTYNTNTDPLVRSVKSASPAVVNVRTRVRTFSPFPTASGIATEVGTGFVVRSSGLILTNDHVVEGASTITVTIPGRGRLPATVAAQDVAHDLAVLKVDATGLPTVSLGNSSGVQLGQRVVAIGYALALNGGPTVTAGIISSLHRTIQVEDPNATSLGGTRTYRKVFQTDAAINPGNSGGPLLNLRGQVVAIDNAGSQQAQNIGFAIPIDEAKPLVDRAVGHLATL